MPKFRFDGIISAEFRDFFHLPKFWDVGKDTGVFRYKHCWYISPLRITSSNFFLFSFSTQSHKTQIQYEIIFRNNFIHTSKLLELTKHTSHIIQGGGTRILPVRVCPLNPDCRISVHALIWLINS